MVLVECGEFLGINTANVRYTKCIIYTSVVPFYLPGTYRKFVLHILHYLLISNEFIGKLVSVAMFIYRYYEVCAMKI